MQNLANQPKVEVEYEGEHEDECDFQEKNVLKLLYMSEESLGLNLDFQKRSAPHSVSLICWASIWSTVQCFTESPLVGNQAVKAL